MHFDVRHISIPFRFQYGHALKQHQSLQAVVCIATDDAGNAGYGEAVPREYVTGESCQSIMGGIQKIACQTGMPPIGSDRCHLNELIRQWQDWAKEWSETARTSFPSCVLSAIDLARCDLMAQQNQIPLAEFLSGTRRPSPSSDQTAKPYCASIGFGKGFKGKLKLSALLFLYKRLGFQHFKLKVGSDDDEARVRYVRKKLGSNVKIFADANAAWTPDEAVRKIEVLAKYNLWAIEEPLQFRPAAKNASGQVDRLSILDSKHFEDYTWLRKRSALALIADESLICHESLTRILDHGAFDILNIRLSKCGGPILSMAMVQRAVSAGLRYSVAAMVGESPILATAGAHFAVASGELTGQAPEYVQGYSHGLLHKVRFATGEPKLRRATVTLGNSGGLGLSIIQRKLDSITVQRCQFQT